MKKIMFFAAAALAMTFASCGNKSGEAANDVDSTAVEEVVEAAEAADINVEALKSGKLEDVKGFMQQAQEKYNQLVAEGKIEEASKYVQQIQNLIKENEATIKSVVGENNAISNLVNTVTALPTTTEAIATAAKAKVEETAKSAVEDAKNQAVDAAKAKANEEAQKVNDKVNDAAKKVNDKVNEGVSNGLKKLGL